jgi:sialic acid synthase SpsE
MSQIIIDMGSGNTCQNDIKIVKRMIDELHNVDSGKHSIIIKWQLFEQAGQNIPLDLDVFRWAYDYARLHGYKTTASVFDKSSLAYLLNFDIPFVKLSNNRSTDYLIGEVPRRIPIYISVGAGLFKVRDGVTMLHCISKYPAKLSEYEYMFGDFLKKSASDHTDNLKLWHKYQPDIYEVHYKLPDSTGLDAGKFARTPRDLKAIL